MRLAIEWSKPIPLRGAKSDGLIYSVDLDLLPKAAGIYIFARKWGASYEALYVGKSKGLRGRVKGHFNNLRLMKHIEKAKSGKR